MGFRQAAALSAVSFCFGVLFIAFNADHRVLYQEPTAKAIDDAFHFYTTFYEAPKAVQALLHGMVGVGIFAFVAKLHKWDESAMFFDGASLVAYVFGVMLYMTVVIPGIRTIATPLPEDTREDQVEALRVLAAANTLIIGCLSLVLVLQAGQEWARRADEKTIAKLAAAETQRSTAAHPIVSDEKKSS